jgi:hypothetical protein
MVNWYEVLDYVHAYESHYFLCYIYVLVYLQHSWTFFFAYKIVSLTYSEYTVNIFHCLKLSLHNSHHFNPAVYLITLY